MEFLELLESVRAEEASVQRMFNADDGQGVRSLRRNTLQYKARLAEAATFVGDVVNGKRHPRTFLEAMTTSDFPFLFGDILDRQLLAGYQETPAVHEAFCRMATVPDFRAVKRFGVSGAEGVLPRVPEQGEYQAAALSDAQYSYSVQKYGRRVPFSWEAMVNDDLDALKDVPARLGRAARRSESKFVTQLYVDANGPHASFYSVGNANRVTSNPVLSIAALQTAMTVLAAQKDADGEPIYIEALVLVVPPALEITAQNILNATQLWLDTNASAGTAQQNLVTTNWMRNRVSLVVDPYIPIVASTANGNTSWFLFASPRNGRPALEFGRLRGHEQPEIFIKAPNAQRVGGGVDAMAGDFDTDSIQYKVRHVFGGTRLDPKMTVASNGSGS